MRTTTLASALILATACGLSACGGDDGTSSDTGFTGADSETAGDGDGDASGDGDGDPSGDGDGDPSGDGDGDPSGDGDGDPSGDGDGDPSGDGDGDPSGDGDGDPTGDGDGDGDPFVPIPCDVPEIELATVVPHVIMVLDKSGSMIANTWDHDADPMTAEITRWKSLHAVVTLIVNNFDEQFEFGAQLYPSTSATDAYNQNACLVNTPPEVLVAPNNGTGVLLGIPTGNSQNIRGGTPTAAGMTSALDHLIAIDDGDPAAVILVTDGAANCRTDAADNADRFETYDPNLLGIVTDAWNDLEIPTYVVGIDIANAVTPVVANGEPDGINPFVQLDALAVAGGKPLGGDANFYETQNQIELEAAIQAIVDDAASCKVILDPMPQFPELVEVIMDGENVPMVTDCATEDGWTFTNPDGPYDALQLCGTWCEQVPMAEVFKAEYYCDPG